MLATLQMICVFAIVMGMVQALLGRDERWRKAHSVGDYFENAGRSIALVAIPGLVALVILVKVFGWAEGD